jgi:hypothetical protein
LFLHIGAVFKYKKGSDSVLVVTKDHYNSCNTTTPIQSLTDGESVFKFDRSGPFYFISGNGDNCRKGQKLIIIVLAVRNQTHHSPPPSKSPVAVSPSPTAETPASPPTTLPPKAESPKGESPKPAGDDTQSDLDAPAPAPSGKSGAPGRNGSVGLALGISIGVSVILSSFVGMV